ncbi:MAG: pilin [bacterium]|nr:pilin [bacterium]
MKKTFLASLLSFLIFFAVGAVLVYAEPVGGNPGSDGAGTPGSTGGGNPTTEVKITLQNPFNCGGVEPCTLFTFLRSVIDNILLPIGGVLAVLAFIYSGFLYVTAQGNEASLKTAHKALLYTAIGTAVLLGSWVIASVIENTINKLGT